MKNQERKIVEVHEDVLLKYINQKELLEIENDELTELIFEFIQEQEGDLSDKFYKFLEKKKQENNYFSDIEFLMLDYK